MAMWDPSDKQLYVVESTDANPFGAHYWVSPCRVANMHGWNCGTALSMAHWGLGWVQ